MRQKLSAPEPIGIGLCGIGRTGFGRVRQEIGALAECRLVGGFDVIRERAEQLAAACAATPHDTFESLLTDPKVDVVVIATRSHQHAAMTIEALAAGKHVVVEKPMATTLVEADAILDAADRSKGKLFVRHNRRFDPAFVAAAEAVRSGKLGVVHLVRVRHHEYVRRSDWQTLREFGGGQLLNWGPHLIDWALQLVGGKAADVWGDCRRVVAGGDAEDHVKLLIRAAGGCVADVEITGAEAMPGSMFHLSGSRGSLVIQGQTCTLRYLRTVPAESVRTNAQTLSQDNRPRAKDDSLDWVEERTELPAPAPAQFWLEVYRHLRLERPFPITLDQAREVMRVIELARSPQGLLEDAPMSPHRHLENAAQKAA